MTATRFIATSVVRHAGEARASGFARVFSRASGAVLTCSPIPESVYRSQDPNPRGGLRGARGVSAWGDRLAVANTERLFVLAPDWRVVREISHPWMGGVHGILAEHDGIWVTCTMSDLLIKLDWEGRIIDEWCWRSDAALVRAFDFARLPAVDRDRDYREPGSSRTRVRNVVHLNSVRRGPQGRLLLSFGRVLSPRTYRRRTLSRAAARLADAVGMTLRPRSPAKEGQQAIPSGVAPGSTYAVVALDTDRRSTVVLSVPDTRVPNHDVWADNDLIVYCDTNQGCLTGADAATGEVRRSVLVPGEPSFVRGLAPLGGLRFLVGSQRPAAVYEVDLAAEAVVATYLLGGDPKESVHNISVVPESFVEPCGTLFGAS